MKIILIDDEPLILEELSYLCEKHKDIEICGICKPKAGIAVRCRASGGFCIL